MADPIRVVFIDASSGAEFARTDVPVSQLPDSFAGETTLQLGEDMWSVVSAAPGSKPEFARTGKLVVTLSRVQTVDPRDIRFSLPTICDHLPTTSGTPSMDTLTLHEDEWRQTELFSAKLSDEVEAELRAIEAIVEGHANRDAEGRITGFDEIHVRRAPATPLGDGIGARELWALLPRPDQVYSGFRFRDGNGVVDGSFALVIGSVVLYGLVPGGRVTVLGITSRPGADTAEAAAGLERVLREFGLRAVDWCRGVVVDAGSVRGLLAGA